MVDRAQRLAVSNGGNLHVALDAQQSVCVLSFELLETWGLRARDSDDACGVFIEKRLSDCKPNTSGICQTYSRHGMKLSDLDAPVTATTGIMGEPGRYYLNYLIHAFASNRFRVRPFQISVLLFASLPIQNS